MTATALRGDDWASTKLKGLADLGFVTPTGNADPLGDSATTLRAMTSPPPHSDQRRGQSATRMWLAGQKPCWLVEALTKRVR